jgi:hypothetical protein
MDWIYSMHDVWIVAVGNPVVDCCSLHQQRVRVTIYVNVSFGSWGAMPLLLSARNARILMKLLIKTLRR